MASEILCVCFVIWAICVCVGIVMSDNRTNI